MTAYTNEILTGSLQTLVNMQREEQARRETEKEQAQEARELVDSARTQLAFLVPEAIGVIAARLQAAPAEGGQGSLKAGEFPIDGRGAPVTRERENVAWEILSRIGIPRLRATAIQASMVSQTERPADAENNESDEDLELNAGTIESQIDAFMAGVAAAQDKTGQKN